MVKGQIHKKFPYPNCHSYLVLEIKVLWIKRKQ